MGYINFTNGAQAGFQNALAMGMQMGAQAREAAERREYKNALAQFDPENPETLQPIMAANPEVGLKLREDVRARQQERELGELTQRAMGGDQAAMQQLATVNFDRWRELGTQTRQAAEREAKVFGNAAMDVLGRPRAEWQAALAAYVQQLGPEFPEIQKILQVPPEQQEAMLRAAVAEAGMVRQMQEMLDPDWRAVPAGGYLENVNPRSNPNVGQGAPVGQRGIPPAAVEALRRGEGTPEQFDEMFGPGAAARIMGGAGSNASGGFPPGQ